MTRHSCDILDHASKRYYALILRSSYHYKVYSRLRNSKDASPSIAQNKTWKANKDFDGYLNILKIELSSPCESVPHDNMEEACVYLTNI